MFEIFKCENRALDNTLVIMDTNGKLSKGVPMLNGVNNQIDDWQIPYNQIKKAREVYDRQGFNAWYNCKKKLGITS